MASRPTPGLIYCQQARDLLDDLALAIHEVITLHEDQFRAVLQGDENTGRFEDLIHMANERKREANTRTSPTWGLTAAPGSCRKT